jgi:hypothetical protein
VRARDPYFNIGRYRFGLAVALTMLTACIQPTAIDSTPVSGSHDATSTNSPQMGGPAASSGASLGGANAVGAGSFPRSFLIPGTDSSIRIGG